MDSLEDVFAQLVLEAKNDRKNSGGINVSDKPEDGDEGANIDYGEGAPTDDTADAPEGNAEPAGDTGAAGTDQGGNSPEGGINVSDRPTGNTGADSPTGPEQGATDYGEGAPTDNDTGGDAGADATGGAENAPSEGGDNPPDDAAGDDQGATDYGEGAPDEGGGGEEGGNDATVDATGEDAPPDDGTGGEGDGPPGTEGGDDRAEGVDESQEDETSRKNANNILLLRNFIRLHKEIRLIIKKVTESRKKSLLATVTYRQVCKNLNELREILYKYILLEYDNSSYDENLFMFNYILETLKYNYDMLNKVKEVHDKAVKTLRKTSKRSIK